VFYDVFGEKYTTKPIDATAATTSALKVQTALENLPNGVIARTHTDVTFEAGAGSVLDQTKTSAVQVSMQKEGGSLTKSGTIGAGKEGGTGGVGTADGGVGSGTWGGGAGTTDTLGYGPEFTITFSTNPGVLRTIELDTRQVTNPGKTDYWVANARQGQFSSRYSTNVGRINTLRYGSKLVYTNDDWTTTVPANTLVKIGAQETVVTAVTTYAATLFDPFLGTSILPDLVDTKITATALADSSAGVLAMDQLTFTTGGAGQVTLATIPDLANGAKLYINGCPIISKGTLQAGGALTDNAADLLLDTNNDCEDNAFSPAALVLYRRGDDTANQNVYKTSGDTAAAANVGVCTTRGSADIYACAATASNDVVASVTNAGVFTTSANVADTAAGDIVFVNGIGPLTTVAVAGDSTTFTAGTEHCTSPDGGSNCESVVLDGVEATCTATNDAAGTACVYSTLSDYFDTGGSSAKWEVREAAANTQMTAGKIILMNGRRYKIKATAAAVAAAAKITLTETYAGGQFVEVCSDCVTDVAATSITTAEKVTFAVGDHLMVSGQTHQQLQVSVDAAVTKATSTTFGSGSYNGLPAAPAASAGLTGTNRLNLYKALNAGSHTPYIITESSSGVTYQYVSQCANRGTCDSSSGICNCFAGYTNDNCDTQNMLAS